MACSLKSNLFLCLKTSFGSKEFVAVFAEVVAVVEVVAIDDTPMLLNRVRIAWKFVERSSSVHCSYSVSFVAIIGGGGVTSVISLVFGCESLPAAEAVKLEPILGDGCSTWTGFAVVGFDALVVTVFEVEPFSMRAFTSWTERRKALTFM